MSTFIPLGKIAPVCVVSTGILPVQEESLQAIHDCIATLSNLPDWDDSVSFGHRKVLFLPYGKVGDGKQMRQKILSLEDLGQLIRKHRRALGMTQIDLAGASHLGPRFIGELERGKPTCEIGKTLQVLRMLGIELEASVPTSDANDK